MELNPRDLSVAGFFHDIGKFLERAKIVLPNEWSTEGSTSLYQPFSKNGNYFTHAHARYSAYFFELFKDCIPSRYHYSKDPNCIPNLSAKHHVPSTPLEWIVAEADRISSGYDRDEFEVYNHTLDKKDFQATRLISLFESAGKISNPEFQSQDGYKYAYPLQKLDVNSCYPKFNETSKSTEQYCSLFKSFDNALRTLDPAILNHEHLWLDLLESLVLRYASFIPSATVDKTIPDVSLFDHLKSTASIAGSLFAYHESNATLDSIDSIKDRGIPKFLLVQGKFFGIQSFIFQEGGSTNRKAAKILRARSAMVNLILESISSRILLELELSNLSRLLYGAGKFTLLLPNTTASIDSIAKVKSETNINLYRSYFGRVSIGIEYLPVSAIDLLPQSLELTMRRLHDQVEESKYKRWIPGKDLGVFYNYLDGFHTQDTETGGLCSYCGERPEDTRVQIDEGHSCSVCADQILLGSSIYTKEALVLIKVKSGELTSGEFFSSLIPKVQWKACSLKDLKNLDPTIIIRQFDLKHKGDDSIINGLVPSPILGYIPYLRDIQSGIGNDFFGRRGLTQDDLGGSDYSPISFWGIGALSIIDGEDGDLQGVSGIAGMKADVDRLGELFRTSFHKPNLSRMATFSRFLEYFFTDVLCNTIQSRKEFKGIYTVFSGGDDLFLIAPYRYAYQFISELKERFSEFTCGNEKMSFSAGISFHKPGHSIRTIAEHSEKELENAKTSRNSYSLFQEKCSWQDSSELWKTFESWNSWREKGFISTGFAYRIHSFIQSRHWEKLFVNKKIPAESEYLTHLLWRSHFKYTLIRTFATSLNPSDREQALEEAIAIPGWIDKYGNQLKHTLWYFIYNHRKKEKNG